MTFTFTLSYIVLDRMMSPIKLKDKNFFQKIFTFLKWLLMPIITLFVSALPGVDAHTRLMLNRKIEYVVAPKKVEELKE